MRDFGNDDCPLTFGKTNLPPISAPKQIWGWCGWKFVMPAAASSVPKFSLHKSRFHHHPSERCTKSSRKQRKTGAPFPKPIRALLLWNMRSGEGSCRYCWILAGVPRIREVGLCWIWENLERGKCDDLNRMLFWSGVHLMEFSGVNAFWPWNQQHWSRLLTFWTRWMKFKCGVWCTTIGGRGWYPILGLRIRFTERSGSCRACARVTQHYRRNDQRTSGKVTKPRNENAHMGFHQIGIRYFVLHCIGWNTTDWARSCIEILGWRFELFGVNMNMKLWALGWLAGWDRYQRKTSNAKIEQWRMDGWMDYLILKAEIRNIQ